MPIHRINIRGQPTGGGPPALGLDEALTTFRRKKKLYLVMKSSHRGNLREEDH